MSLLAEAFVEIKMKGLTKIMSEIKAFKSQSMSQFKGWDASANKIFSDFTKKSQAILKSWRKASNTEFRAFKSTSTSILTRGVTQNSARLTHTC